MSYQSGGLIQATDYNNFINGTNQLNAVWGTGSSDSGYGQTPISTVNVSTLVTATQWATLINTLNTVRTHQSGTGSGISAVTAGQPINYIALLSSSINTAYTNRVSFASQGTTTTGTVYSPVVSAASGIAYNSTVATRSVTFASGDAARYFFNTGGQINFIITSVSGLNGTARSADVSTLMATNFVSWNGFRASSSLGRTGSGGTLNTNATTTGYYGITATAASTQLLCQITSTTAAYTTDVMRLYVYSSTQNVGGNGDKGLTVYFQLTLNSPGHLLNDIMAATINHRVDIVEPETTNITKTWGTITVA